MKLERMIGARIKSLSNLLKRQVDQSMSEIGIEPLTGMQGRIVGYLGHHQDQDVFQRDIEEEFQIRRSTATGILQLLEKKGLLERRPVARDGRLNWCSLPRLWPSISASKSGSSKAKTICTAALRRKNWSSFLSSPTSFAIIWRRNKPIESINLRRLVRRFSRPYS